MTKTLFYHLGGNVLFRDGKGLTKGTKDSYKVTHCSNTIPLTRSRAAWLQKPSGKELLYSPGLSEPGDPDTRTLGAQNKPLGARALVREALAPTLVHW